MPPIVKFLALLACVGFVIFVMYASRNHKRANNKNDDASPIGSSSSGDKNHIDSGSDSGSDGGGGD